MKKVLTAALAAAMVLLAGTGLYAQSSSGKTEITYWYPWGGDSEKWDLWRIGEFEKANPDVHVNAVYVPDDGGIKNGKLLAAIAGGKGPDVVVTNEAALAYTMASNGALESMDDAMKAVGFKASDLYDAFTGLMKYKGKTYIFPHDTNVSMLFYNVDLFKAAGLDPDKPPKTIAELNAAAKALTKAGPDGTFQQIGFIPWIDGNEENPFLYPFLFGADFYDADTNRIVLNTPALISYFNWIKTYAKTYDPTKIQSFSKGFGGAFSPDHPFFTGKVAMTVNGNWFSNAIKLYKPTLNYKVAFIPADGKRYGASAFGTNVFIMPKGAKQKEAALRFMMFASKPEISASNINTWRSLSVWKGASAAVKWYDKDGNVIDPIYKLELAIANNPNSGHPALTAVASQMLTELKQLRDKVIFTQADPAPLLKDLEARMQKELDKKK
jgi:ABC-type glycerol-3-phosphate transport system substrate-binding protein